MKKVLHPTSITILLFVLFTIVTFTAPEAYKYNRIFLVLYSTYFGGYITKKRIKVNDYLLLS